MLADYMILVPMQYIGTKFKNSKVQCICRSLSPLRLRKRLLWEFKAFESIVGKLYTLYPEDALFLDQPFFDFEIEHIDGKNYEYRLIAQKEWIDTVIDILDYYLDKSPTGVIGVLFRAEAKIHETVLGVHQRDEFVDFLKKGKLYFNKEYFVSINREEEEYYPQYYNNH